MINGKPTDEQLETAAEVVEWVADYFEAKEPYAVNTIETFRDAYNSMPCSDDLEEM